MALFFKTGLQLDAILNLYKFAFGTLNFKVKDFCFNQNGIIIVYGPKPACLE